MQRNQIFIATLVLFIATDIFAQEKTMRFFTANGPTLKIPIGQYQQTRGVSVAPSLGIEYFILKHTALSLLATFDNYTFESAAIRSDVRGLSLSARGRYRFIDKKMTPYITFGVGIIQLNTPILTPVSQANSREIDVQGATRVAFESGIGFDVELSRRSIFFVEAVYNAISTDEPITSSILATISVQASIRIGVF